MDKSNDEKFKGKELDEKSFGEVSGGMVLQSGLVTKDQRLDQVNLARKHRFEDNAEIRKNVGFGVDKVVSVVDAGLKIAAAAQGIPVGGVSGVGTSEGYGITGAAAVVNPLAPSVEAPGSGAREVPKAAVKSPLDEFLK